MCSLCGMRCRGPLPMLRRDRWSCVKSSRAFCPFSSWTGGGYRCAILSMDSKSEARDGNAISSAVVRPPRSEASDSAANLSSVTVQRASAVVSEQSPRRRVLGKHLGYMYRHTHTTTQTKHHQELQTDQVLVLPRPMHTQTPVLLLCHPRLTTHHPAAPHWACAAHSMKPSGLCHERSFVSRLT